MQMRLQMASCSCVIVRITSPARSETTNHNNKFCIFLHFSAFFCIFLHFGFRVGFQRHTIRPSHLHNAISDPWEKLAKDSLGRFSGNSKERKRRWHYANETDGWCVVEIQLEIQNAEKCRKMQKNAEKSTICCYDLLLLSGRVK